MKPEFYKDLHKLLSIQSVASRPEKLNEALDFAARLLGDGFTIERFNQNNKPSALIYAAKKRPGKFRLLLNAHLDVIDAPDQQFKPVKKNGRIFARGVLDMKTAALAMIYAFRENAYNLPYDLALQLVTDEEVGGHDGTRYQINYRKVRAETVMIGEFTRLRLTVKGKGMIRAQLKALGTSSHAAYPWDGTNALDSLLASLERMRKVYPVYQKPVWETTFTISKIDTPNQNYNKTPDEAEAWLDIRQVKDDKNFSSRSKTAKWLKNYSEPNVEVNILSYSEASDMPEDSRALSRLKEAMTAEGIEPQYIEKHGSSDARFFKDSELICLGPSGAGAHSSQEYLELDSIEPYYKILNRFIQSL